MFDAGAVAARLTLDRSDFTRNLAAARADAARGITVPLDFSVAQNSAARAIVAAKALFRSNPVTVPLTFSVSQTSVMRAIVAARSILRSNPITIPVKLSVSAAEMARVGAVMQAYFLAHPVVIPVIFGPRPGPVPGPGGGPAGGAGGGGGGGFFGLLGRQIPLFGGALGTNKLVGEVAVWHLLVDWVIEFSAVLIPAAIALGAFGIAGAGTAKAIYGNFQNISTIVSATGRSFNIVSANASKAASAVKPEVYQLWGDVITLATQKGGGFATMASATGHALDQLGARFVVAVTSGSHMGGIMSTGAQDVSKLGDVIGNLGGTIGNLLKVMPGFAGDFLNLWVGISKGAEILTSFAGPAIHWLLWAHGVILYGGLAVTAIMKIGPAVVKAAGAVYDFVLATSASIGVFIGDLIAADGAVATFAVLSDALMPWGWVALGVVAIGGLIYWLVSGRTAAQNMLSTLQKGILGAATTLAGVTDIHAAQTQVAQNLIQAHVTLNSTVQTGVIGHGRAGQAVTGTTQAYQQALTAVQQLTSGQRQLSDEQNLYNYRVTQLGYAYGGARAASGLLVLAGVPMKMMLSTTASAWAQIKQMVAATVLGYKQMGVTGGSLGNDLQIMNSQVSDQYVAMGKLNGALDTFIGNVTKTQSSFDTYAQGLGTLRTSAKATGASMDGLNANSLTLNSTFATQVTNANALIDTWRLAGIANNLQTAGIKASIAPMVQYARGSTEATAQLVALAEEAGYNGPAAMKNLVAWLGKTGDSTRTLKSITDQATLQEALLTRGMNDQGAVIAGRLLGDLNNAILKYGGVDKAVTAYGKAIATQGAQSDAAQSARTALINSIITTAQRTHEATGEVAAFISKLLGIPLKKAVEIVVTATGDWSVVQSNIPGRPGSGQAKHPGTLAAGALITAGTTSTADDVLVRVSKGETVVSAAHSAVLAPTFRAVGVPGYAGGGYIGNLPGLSAYDLQSYNTQVLNLEKAVAAATAAAINSAQAASSAAAVSSAGAGAFAGQGGGNAANAALARRMMPAWSTGSEWAAWNSVAMRESGWSSIAANPTSDARGIAQNINGWSAGYQYGNAAQQIAWMISYIEQRYRDPIGAWQHEISAGWYDRGGYLPTGVSFAVNNTGRPERVSAPDADVNLGAKLDRVIALLDRAPARTGAHTAAGVADALNGAAKSAAYKGMHTSRGRGW